MISVVGASEMKSMAANCSSLLIFVIQRQWLQADSMGGQVWLRQRGTRGARELESAVINVTELMLVLARKSAEEKKY